MAKVKEIDNDTKSAGKPATTPEVREMQLISRAIDLAEKQLIDGTATSQVITHFLKLATEKEKLEREKLEKENALLEARREAIKAAQEQEELFEEAIRAMKSYGGNHD